MSENLELLSDATRREMDDVLSETFNKLMRIAEVASISEIYVNILLEKDPEGKSVYSFESTYETKKIQKQCLKVKLLPRSIY